MKKKPRTTRTLTDKEKNFNRKGAEGDKGKKKRRIFNHERHEQHKPGLPNPPLLFVGLVWFVVNSYLPSRALVAFAVIILLSVLSVWSVVKFLLRIGGKA
ncbi:hypothetical protein FACS189450_03570 [Spirochaetia bacterium]|nr:hypothetical protein FACS189450_03570 [Spirochaetia bacterium]